MAGEKLEPDQITPVVVSPLTVSAQPVPGTDGKYHVVYELVLTNTNPIPATLKTLEVLLARSEGSGSAGVIASYEGDALLSRVRTLVNTPANSSAIEFNGTRLFLIDLTLDPRAQVPAQLRHRFQVMGASTPAPSPMAPVALRYTVAPLNLAPPPLEIGPPLSRNGGYRLTDAAESAVHIEGPALA